MADLLSVNSASSSAPRNEKKLSLEKEYTWDGGVCTPCLVSHVRLPAKYSEPERKIGGGSDRNYCVMSRVNHPSIKCFFFVKSNLTRKMVKMMPFLLQKSFIYLFFSVHSSEMFLSAIIPRLIDLGLLYHPPYHISDGLDMLGMETLAWSMLVNHACLCKNGNSSVSHLEMRCVNCQHWTSQSFCFCFCDAPCFQIEKTVILPCRRLHLKAHIIWS